MPRRTRHLLFIGLTVLATACFDSKDEDEDDEGSSSTPAVDRYVTALCRLYSEPACTSAMEEECGFSFSFDSQGECEALFGATARACPEAVGVIEGMAETVEECAAALDALECGVDPLCASDTGAEGGLESIAACNTVEAATEGLCDDTGGWDTAE